MVIKIGTDADERLHGTRGADILDGRGGDDHVLGRRGDDVLLGGPGANRLDGGPGRDTAGFLFDEEDVLVRAAGEVDLAAGTLIVQGVTTRLVGIEDAYGTGRLAGNGGPNRLLGGAGADTIRGRGGDDFLVGDEGRDTMHGGPGADTIDAGSPGTDEGDVARGGPGGDLLRLGQNDEGWGGAGADQFSVGVQVFGSGGPPGPLFTIRDFDPSEGDVVGLPIYPVFRGEDAVTERHTFVGERPLAANGTPELGFEHRGRDTIVRYEVADGPELGQVVNEIRLSGQPALSAGAFLLGFATGAGDDAVTGTRFADQISPGFGDDRVDGRGGDDGLSGGPGADRLRGGRGDDRLDGNAGDDIVVGGPGDDVISDVFAGPGVTDDTYLFVGHFGHDTIDDGGGNNRFVFRGFARAEVELLRNGADLEATVAATGDTVRIRGFYVRPGDVALVFEDGTVLGEEATAWWF
jgi:Ca2+-binding RTX toxin-like protein